MSDLSRLHELMKTWQKKAKTAAKEKAKLETEARQYHVNDIIGKQLRQSANFSWGQEDTYKKAANDLERLLKDVGEPS